jgi:hypothetical protein
LSQRDAYQARLRRELADLRARRAGAAAVLAERQAAVEVARAAAATARAERAAVERHREGWDEDARRRRDRAED